ncbi:uncharacterized protein LOC115882411 [Sitophilus oryzae]|uniref:Uncharacterized protein LOC115882411 n=1 Tax=Sitophilus oryzae TaxID=7048 RepID=A0A6J2XZX7_SITOR|nr:uncharacterized protein LOC115882411 [Sitophilus oryzae]
MNHKGDRLSRGLSPIYEESDLGSDDISPRGNDFLPEASGDSPRPKLQEESVLPESPTPSTSKGGKGKKGRVNKKKIGRGSAPVKVQERTLSSSPKPGCSRTSSPKPGPSTPKASPSKQHRGRSPK